ncbi:MAG: rRNA pseudouridine synthase [Firmicutes bacterium]|nr:rRNA pseudouridine synthase [Bacillota bacterium]
MERLQKILAHAGVASRRECEQLIQNGHVSVNGRVVTELGTKADPSKDQIRVNGKLIQVNQRLVYIMLNKPRGYITSVKDELGRKTVLDLVHNVSERIYPVGRLDYDSEGLLLLTNDGKLANKLMHPRYGVKKTYLVEITGLITDDDLNRLENGVIIDQGVRTLPADVQLFKKGHNKSLVKITISEGKNRQVRKMFQAVGYKVTRLQRISFGPLSLGNLHRGTYRNLSSNEVNQLKRAVKQP